MRASDVIMNVLADNGITDAFCVTGGGAMFLNNSLANNQRIKTYFNHHEQAAAMAAEAYAKLSGKIALVCVTSGPGGTNTLTGIAGAYVDNIPLIVISGQVRYETTIAHSGLPLRQRGEQEFDIVNTVKTMTKYANMVVNPLAVKQEVQKALDIALNGRRGPVWLDIPLNVQSAEINENDLLPVLSKPETIFCGDDDINKVFELLTNAERPCILAGSAILASWQRSNFFKLLEKIKAPVVNASVIPDVIYREHPLYAGSTGLIGTRAGNIILQSADVILSLGCGLRYKQTGFLQETFAPNAKIIMVDVDENEAKKPGLRIHKFIHCDLKAFFEAALLDKRKITAPVNWLNHSENLNKRFDIFENADGKENEKVNSCNFWKIYSELESDDSVTVLGNNSGSSHRLQGGNKKINQRTIANFNYGSMGYDIPAAVGAAVAAGYKKYATLITGDGSFMMNMQELQTIAHNELPVKIVLFSNEGYDGIRQTCKNYFSGKFFGCTKESGISFPDFEKLAALFGFEYHLCRTNGEIESSLKWLFSSEKRCFLEVKQIQDNPVLPKVVSRMNADGTSSPSTLEDMFPFIDKTELNDLMNAV